jgi:hypothetical protein
MFGFRLRFGAVSVSGNGSVFLVGLIGNNMDIDIR